MMNLKDEHELINKELSQFSYKIKRKFEELFPCTNPLNILEVYSKEHCEAIGLTNNYDFDKIYYTIEYLEYESIEEFWFRWNKFKKMVLFI